MKYCLLPLLFCLMLVSCTQPKRVENNGCDPSTQLKKEPAKIDPATPPSGEEAMRILLKNQSFPLKGTGCSSGPNDQDTLQDLLVVALGEAIGMSADKQLIISGRCEAEQFELKSGSIIDGWRCHLYANTQFIKGAEDIYGMSIAFGIRKDNREFITDSITPSPLICMP